MVSQNPFKITKIEFSGSLALLLSGLLSSREVVEVVVVVAVGG